MALRKTVKSQRFPRIAVSGLSLAGWGALGASLALVGLLGNLLTGTPASAARFDRVPGSRYTDVRAAGLGDAYIPLVDDGAGGLFYNPAAIAKQTKTHFELLNFSGQINGHVADQFSRNTLGITSLGSYAGQLAANPGTTPGFAGSLFPNFFFRGVAIGALMNVRTHARSDGNGNITYRSLYQLIPTAGFALPLARGIVRIGYSIQWVHQASGERTVSASDPNLGYNDGLAEGSGISHNAGFQLTFPIQLLPSFTLVARNIGGMTYKDFTLMKMASNPSGVPEREAMTFDAAFSLQPKMGRGNDANLVIQARDVTNRSGTSILQRMALGFEFTARRVFQLRLGFGGGYPSAGFGFRKETAEFGVAWYSEELGSEFRSQRDIRGILQYKIRLF